MLLANAWDVGSARLLEGVGFQALATTSSGHAASLGRLDYQPGREETLAHAASLADAVDVPVSADLEDCFGVDPSGVAETIRGAREAGLAGCSIEDWNPREERLYSIEEAVARVEAAVCAADGALVLTARAENHLRGNPDLADTIARLRAYGDAGAEVLYAPGVVVASDIRELVAAVEQPVNVLLRPGCPSVPELAGLGVGRVSVGGAFAFLAYSAAIDAAREMMGPGTCSFLEGAAAGSRLTREIFAE